MAKKKIETPTDPNLPTAEKPKRTRTIRTPAERLAHLDEQKAKIKATISEKLGERILDWSRQADALVWAVKDHGTSSNRDAMLEVSKRVTEAIHETHHVT